MKKEKDLCNICGNEPKEKKWIGHFNLGNSPHVHILEAFCSTCGIFLSRKTEGKNDTGWQSSFVNLRELECMIQPPKIEELETKFKKYPKTLEKWYKLTSQLTENDELWMYRSPESNSVGAVIKRQNHMIGSFIFPDSMKTVLLNPDQSKESFF